MKKTSDFEFRQQTSLSQRVGFQIPIIQKLAGSDPEISNSIATLTYIDNPENMKLLEKDPLKWIVGLLNVLRLAAFATSPHTNEISKMGFMLPAQEIRIIDE
jgi:hypothetical protein